MCWRPPSTGDPPAAGLGSGDPVMQLWFMSRVTQNCVISHVCWVSPGLGMALPGTDRQVRSGGNGPLTVGGMGLVLSLPWVQLSPHMLVLGLCPHEESLVTGPSG